MDNQPKTRKEKIQEMHQRSAINRKQFREELQSIPKMSPGKLILILGWSLGMSALDNTIINIANPNIQTEPNFINENEKIDQSLIQWINDLYSISFAAFGIPAAKIGDRYGNTIVHRYGVIGFVLFSILCGCSKFIKQENTWQYGGFYVLLVARLFQGIFAAFLMSNSITLCGILVEAKDVGKSMAYNSMCFALGAGLGPVLGGVLTQYAGWEYNFFINVIIGIVSIVVCWIYLPKTPKFREDKLDWVGGLLILVALVVLILGFTFIPPVKEQLVLGICLTLVGIALIVAFVFWEKYHPFAIIPQKILTDKKLVFALLGALLNFALITPVTFQMPFALQGMRCIAPTTVGLMCLASPIAQVIAAICGSKLAAKVTSLYIKLITSVIIAALVITFGFIINGNIAGIVATAFFFAFVLMLYFVSNNMFMMRSASEDTRGMLGGCMQAFRESGLAIGIAICNLIEDLLIGKKWGDKPAPISADCKGPEFEKYRDIYFEVFQWTDIIMSGLAVLALIFGTWSGFSDYEFKLIGFPKKKKAHIEQILAIKAENEAKLKAEQGQAAAPETVQQTAQLQIEQENKSDTKNSEKLPILQNNQQDE